MDGVPILASIIAVLLVTVAVVALVNMALGLLPYWGCRTDHVATFVRPAVPAASCG